MILAGIDEAGYGPVLGPLVVGCCAFEVALAEGETIAAGKLPCLWKRLRQVAGKTRDRKGMRLHINDSKLVYTPAAGLKELERAVLSLSGTVHGPCEGLEAFLGQVAGHVLADLRGYSWYAAAPEEKFPLSQDGASVRIMANALKAEMQRLATMCIHLSARVLPERQLNAMLEQTRNKSSVLFSTAACHLDHLLRTYGRRGLVIFCDRQGGREHYGSLLRLMFPDWSLQIVQEVDACSEYALLSGEHAVRLIFREKAEAQCLPVAAASMLCKYIREALMHRFNAYWCGLVPGLTPTAGYYTDGMRFLADIQAKRQELGIADRQLIRMR